MVLWLRRFGVTGACPDAVVVAACVDTGTLGKRSRRLVRDRDSGVRASVFRDQSMTPWTASSSGGYVVEAENLQRCFVWPMWTPLVLLVVKQQGLLDMAPTVLRVTGGHAGERQSTLLILWCDHASNGFLKLLGFLLSQRSSSQPQHVRRSLRPAVERVSDCQDISRVENLSRVVVDFVLETH